ncbi:hypothetical protein CONPUDRAFT_146281 [Coniophora puteana RWD-64-598 SS2]|uniref:Uncharacterized protein n=1 Tax=Coniophora puteana (strain RWD-64-598) TaxID=741705 RepID=A0A5M3MDC1_CONPW|nr:uncharacterized protein CONPUDRAFT_146281 [Coniophora puteana RWD-64-598 SS2]EIW77252.1 hypothetical protein CONPUDRAFT_146281 [Coniophora puteana RWD-64-598 SS2]
MISDTSSPIVSGERGSINPPDSEVTRLQARLIASGAEISILATELRGTRQHVCRLQHESAARDEVYHSSIEENKAAAALQDAEISRLRSRFHRERNLRRSSEKAADRAVTEARDAHQALEARARVGLQLSMQIECILAAAQLDVIDADTACRNFKNQEAVYIHRVERAELELLSAREEIEALSTANKVLESDLANVKRKASEFKAYVEALTLKATNSRSLSTRILRLPAQDPDPNVASRSKSMGASSRSASVTEARPNTLSQPISEFPRASMSSQRSSSRVSASSRLSRPRPVRDSLPPPPPPSQREQALERELADLYGTKLALEKTLRDEIALVREEKAVLARATRALRSDKRRITRVLGSIGTRITPKPMQRLRSIKDRKAGQGYIRSSSPGNASSYLALPSREEEGVSFLPSVAPDDQLDTATVLSDSLSDVFCGNISLHASLLTSEEAVDDVTKNSPPFRRTLLKLKASLATPSTAYHTDNSTPTRTCSYLHPSGGAHLASSSSGDGVLFELATPSSSPHRRDGRRNGRLFERAPALDHRHSDRREGKFIEEMEEGLSYFDDEASGLAEMKLDKRSSRV